MIPIIQENTTNNLQTSFVNRTYKIDLVSNSISGYVDGIEAIKQAIYKTLDTERFSYVIYSSGYGSELIRFIGQNTTLAQLELQRTIEEALLVDDRIISITNFKIDKIDKGSIYISFDVNTIEGNLKTTKEFLF